MTKSINEFRKILGSKESSGNYKNERNKKGYMGKYQMGEAALVDAGY